MISKSSMLPTHPVISSCWGIPDPLAVTRCAGTSLCDHNSIEVEVVKVKALCLVVYSRMLNCRKVEPTEWVLSGTFVEDQEPRPRANPATLRPAVNDHALDVESLPRTSNVTSLSRQEGHSTFREIMF